MPDLEPILEIARRELLDLSARNRLINTHRGASKSSRLEIVDEKGDSVFRRLVIGGKSMSFLASNENNASQFATPTEDENTLLQPYENAAVESSDSSDDSDRHIDSRLQTTLESDSLQKRLLKIEREALTYEQEQGVNVLYLAIGFLAWQEEGSKGAMRQAPLVLVPVQLKRQSATAQFRVTYTGEEITTNLSIKERLHADFRIVLPDISETIEDFSVSSYFAKVTEAIQSQTTWKVLPDDIVLWFFSFSKFLMYRNLTSGAWPADKPLQNNSSLRKLLIEGFDSGVGIFSSNEEPIDHKLRVSDTVHVLDADSSQAIVIEEVRQGRNLVVQGPPGTGKSQTIANMIAAAVNEGKRVLFVAEKMAALDVVKRRLKKAGLGDICFELHSNKANRRTVLDELDRTLKLQQPRLPNTDEHCTELETAITHLNDHARVMNTPVGRSGLTPYQLIGEITKLRENGVRGRSFVLNGCLEWDRATANSLLNKAHNLASLAQAVGNPSEHPWRGVGLEVVLPTDIDRMQDSLKPISLALTGLLECGTELASKLGVPKPKDARGLAVLANLAKHLAAVPDSLRRHLASPVWREQRQAIDALIASGKSYQGHRNEFDGQLDSPAWETDVLAARQSLKAHGHSWFRWFVPSYRSSVATLKSIVADKPPQGYAARLALFDAILVGQKTKAELESDRVRSVAVAAFGELWKGVDSDWETFSYLATTDNRCAEVAPDLPRNELARRIGSADELKPLVGQIAQSLKPLFEQLVQFLRQLKFDLVTAFSEKDIYAVPFQSLMDRISQWQQEYHEISHWTTYRMRSRDLSTTGIKTAVELLAGGQLAADDFAPAVEMAYYESLMRCALTANPHLASFSGSAHSRIRNEFCRLDEMRKTHACAVVAKRHFEGIPAAEGVFGEIGIVRREINKKSRHLPIRKLISQAGRAIQSIKPVFMMSPISIAQFLPPGEIAFDLLLIDEASQVQPVDAFGAVAIANQVVVVGDSKQLPPTSFFDRATTDEGDEPDEDDESQTRAADLESILGMYCARNVPQRMLRWHYRSRHHSLIAFSNHAFYDDELYVVPSPGGPRPNEGLRFEYVEGGCYERGGSRTNRKEAKVVAKAVMQHARSQPDRSLGVGAFSVAQRDAILDELELLRRQDALCERFFVSESSEPFFVKNLENIQGDERDCIIISVGYGKDESGYMSMFFGPLSQQGGERRLNVLISRARELCTVFSSIRAADIDLQRASMPGAISFKGFLKYAETGLLDTGVQAGEGDFESEFERQVALALKKHGHLTHPQVGVAGFRIDLAVVDSRLPGRYLLGIECDGANYHRSRSARDRDRIRESVLQERGWNLHRIWSTDWFNHTDDELRKLISAIEDAYAAGDIPSPEPVSPPQTISIIEREAFDKSSGSVPSSSVPYLIAEFPVDSSREIYALSAAELAVVVIRIVEIEGPIHVDEVARRITRLWGLSRTGSRIAGAVTAAINKLIRAQTLLNEEGFLAMPGQQVSLIRDRASASVATVRKPEMIPPSEVRASIEQLVSDYFGISREQTVKETANLLGIGTLRTPLRERIEIEIDQLISNGSLQQREFNLYSVRTTASVG
ncbi:MAG: DUF3320 domain-containing protein [Pirellulales bacterium]